MILIQLDKATRDELKTLRRQELPPRVRDRLDMVLLSFVTWSPARIATHLGYCAPTVRSLLKDFLDRGSAALFPRLTGPLPDLQRHQQVTQVLTDLLAQERTWTSRQLATALAERDIRLSARQVRRYLEMMGVGWRRTTNSLRHKQDPVKVARATRVLNNLKKASAGHLKLYYLDECGFAPTLPRAHSWSLPGQRKRIGYESLQGRRVNAMAAYRPYGISPRLEVFTAERTWDSYDLLGFLGALPRAKAHGSWCWAMPACTPAM